MWLLLDAGNTRLKWRFTDGERLLDGGSLLIADEQLAQRLRSVFWGQHSVSRVIASNVAGTAAESLIEEVMRDTLAVDPEFVCAAAEFRGLRNGYAVPETLGTDRWVAMIGAREMVQGPICIVDCGTAITLDWVTANGLHTGGMIIPGMQLMRDCLVAATWQIRNAGQNDMQFIGLLGTDTQTCIASGVVASVAGMIERTVRKLGGDAEVQCLISGGDGPVFAASLEIPNRLVPDLIFRGLLAYAKG